MVKQNKQTDDIGSTSGCFKMFYILQIIAEKWEVLVREFELKSAKKQNYKIENL